MPLLKRKPYVLKSPPRDLRSDELVFQVRFTKEIFRDYEEYLSHVNLYRRRLWTCKVTGKQNLTYEEALVSERRATERVQQFPKEFMGPVLSMVQFSPLRIDELVDRIYKEFKDRFVVNEEALGKSGDSFCPCKIVKVLAQHSKEDYRYDVAWLDEDGKKFNTSTEPAVRLTRKKQPFTRALLKAFIREAASSGSSRNSIWLVKNKLARKYKIPVEPPERIDSEEQTEPVNNGRQKTVEIEVVENGGHNTRKRRKTEDSAGRQEKKIVKRGTSLDVKEARKEGKGSNKGTSTETGKERKAVKKGSTSKMGSTTESRSSGKEKTTAGKKGVAPPPPPPTIKYPIEDTLVKPSPDDPVFEDRPIASTDFLLPMECLGNLLMVWDFCASFSKALHLSPFSLEELEKSLDYREGNAPLILETLFALVRTNLSDPVLREEFVKKRKRKSEVSVNTLKDDVSDLLELINKDKMAKYLPSIRLGNYKQIEASEKLEILQELIDKSLGSGIIRAQLEENIEEHQVLAAKKRGEDVEGSKRKKQAKLTLNGTADGVGEANGNSKDGENMDVDEDGNSADEKDAIKTEENGQAMGWKTKGKRKLGGNHSPVSGNGEVKKEEEQETKSSGKSRQAILKAKESIRLVEDQENERKKTEDSKKTQDKKKVQTDASSDRKLQDQMLAESQKRQEQLDRELEKRSIRTTPLGKDRNHNVYWFFHREGRLFVEDKNSRNWGYYSAKEELDALLGSLNPKGVRERLLQKQMEKHYQKISNALTRRSKGIAQKISVEDVAVRRSVRVRTAPRITGFLAYVNKLRQT
ncbi:hypothetical protein Mapa_009893 [Marchantia paleacea]|nr:hypothetical protein Mapa_009893 [Marchantia paleacea]